MTEYFQHHIIHRVMASWQFFHKYLKPTLKKLCEKDPSNWDKYLNQVLTSYRVTPNLATAEMPFFLVYGQHPNLPLHQLLQCFPRRSWFQNAKPRSTQTSSSYSKEDPGQKQIQMTQKNMDQTPPSFKIQDRVYFKNKQPSKWDLKWRPGYRIVCIEHDRHFLHIENQATGKVQSCNVKDVILELPIEFWNIDTQFGRAGRYINHAANLPTIKLND